MHAIVCHEHGGPEVLRYERLARPEPEDDEVLIEAEAIGVNYVDIMRRSGRHPAAPPAPFTPGIEVCGRVRGLGQGVTRFRIGDRVVGRRVTHGAYAEFVCTAERFTAAIPDGIDSEHGAALFVTGQTAFHALVTMGQLAPGETVLVTAAAGGVGSCAIQIGKALGARVVAAAGSAMKCARASESGADSCVDYSQVDWAQRVLELTDGRGADLIVESVGGDVGRECQRCWAAGGRLVVYGKASGTPISVSGDDLLFDNRVVYGLAVGTVIENEALMRAAMDSLLDWMDGKLLQLHIGRTYPLRDAASAHRDLENRQTTGKLILLPQKGS